MDGDGRENEGREGREGREGQWRKYKREDEGRIEECIYAGMGFFLPKIPQRIKVKKSRFLPPDSYFWGGEGRGRERERRAFFV